MLKIGVDPGYGAIKCAQVIDSTIKTFVLPSTVGLVSGDKSGLNLGGIVSSGKAQIKPFHVRFNSLEYLTGPAVESYSQPIDRLDFDRFTESPELKASLYTALFGLLGPGIFGLQVAMALPVEVVQDKDNAEYVQNVMKKWLVGKHAFSVNGHSCEVEILSLRSKIPQPLSSWSDWIFNEDGQIRRSKEEIVAPALIIDQGFNTLDIFALEGGNVDYRLTAGETLGMRRAAEKLQAIVSRKYELELGLREASDLLLNSFLYVEGQRVEIKDEVNQAFKALEADVISFLQKIIGKVGRRYRVLFTGGGALVMGQKLKRLYPHGEIITEPVTANARGLAKMAQRAGFFGV